jgi:hypothetical protein
MKVVFIAGAYRSGSTLLQNILGQISRYFTIGELHYLWYQLNSKNKFCSCKKLLLECEMWEAIFEKAFGGIQNINLTEIIQYNESFRVKHLPFLWIPPINKHFEYLLVEYVEVIRNIFEAIYQITDNKVIVESSKLPTFGVILQMIPNIELHVIHLVRDSRAVAHSWMRKKSFVPDGYPHQFMKQKKPGSSALQWMANNLLTELYMKKSVASYSIVNYENLVSNPKQSMEEIMASINEEDAELPFVSSNSVLLNKQLHSIAGNVTRFDSGEIKLVLDDKWKRNMNTRSKIIVSSLTTPLLLHYKYPLVLYDQVN